MKKRPKIVLLVVSGAALVAAFFFVLAVSYLNRPVDLSGIDFDLPEDADPLVFPREPRPEVQAPERRALLELPVETPQDGQALKYLEELLKLEEQEGRENAMTHYVRAHWLMPKGLDGPTYSRLKEVAEKGWSEEAQALVPLLDAWGPALEAIRKGAALDYARGIGLTDGFLTPVPVYLEAQWAARILCARGRRLEYQGKPGEAMDEYLTVLTMGRDYGAKGSMLWGSLISVAMESIAIERIRCLAEDGDVGEERLRRTLARLREIENTNGALMDAMLLEYEGQLHAIRRALEEPEAAAVFFRMSQRRVTVLELIGSGFESNTWDAFLFGIVLRVRIRWNPGRAVPDHRAVGALLQEYLASPWWSPQRAELALKIEARVMESHVLLSWAMPSFRDALGRSLVAEAGLLEAQLACALELWRLQHERYPLRIEDLYEPWFDGAGPIDPFGGGPFVYRTNLKAAGYHLWSVGPDSDDDGGVLRYDATNGSASSGDVF